jgi:hypothetical protein
MSKKFESKLVHWGHGLVNDVRFATMIEENSQQGWELKTQIERDNHITFIFQRQIVEELQWEYDVEQLGIDESSAGMLSNILTKAPVGGWQLEKIYASSEFLFLVRKRQLQPDERAETSGGYPNGL